MLEIWLDGFVLLVEVGQIGDDILDDIGVGEGVDLRLLFCVGWDTACELLVFAPKSNVSGYLVPSWRIKIFN